MASSLKSRIVRLEMERGGAGVLIVYLEQFGLSENDCKGVSVNGGVTSLAAGENIETLEQRLMDEIERRNQSGVFTVFRV